MNMIKNIEIKQEHPKSKNKRKVRILYVEADEDHVPLQNGGSVEPKLVYVHEGIIPENFNSKRKKLINARYFGGIYKSSEDLWLEVLDYIHNNYDIDYLEKVYIAGDGASWIRQGVEWIPKSKFVLDKYHLRKYVLKATGHVDKSLRQQMNNALNEADKEYLLEVFGEIISKTNEESKIKAVMKSRKYMLDNWDGIKVYEEGGLDVVGCSAEGHVSHLFSDRLSSRPRGWSRDGVDKMARLRVYKKNGGKVYDLVMAQKQRQKNKKKEKIQKELHRKIVKKAKKHFAGHKNNITVLNIGKKTSLYRAIKYFRGA